MKRTPDIALATDRDFLDALHLTRGMDRKEAHAMTGLGWRDTLEQTFRLSVRAFSGRIDDKLVCVFGVAPLDLLAGKGIPWMVGTDLVEDHARVFLRNSRYSLDLLKDGFSYLENHVHKDNDLAIGWLRSLGFVIHEAAPAGPFGEPFHRFTWEA